MLRRLQFPAAACAIVSAALAAVAFPSAARADFWSDLFGGGAPKHYAPRSVPQPHRAVVRPRSRPAAEVEHAKPAVPAAHAVNGPLLAVVSISSQRVAIYDGAGAILHARVSTGQPGHRTPLGLFSVIEKARYHESNIYSGAPMPFMQRITWSGIAMHAGYIPGYPASHGCIRMPQEFASQLFGMTKVGMHVVVSPRDVEAVPFTHPVLPEPRMELAPNTGSDTPVAASRPALVEARLVTGSVATDQAAAATAPVAMAPGLINPQQRAIRERDRARIAAADAIKAEKSLLEASHQASAMANRAADELKAARFALAAAQGQLLTAQASLVQTATPEAQVAQTEAAARVAEAQQRLAEAQAAETRNSDLAFAAAEAWRKAEAKIDTTRAAAKTTEKSVEPLSIFVSRKSGRLYVRQGFTPMFDLPVTIKGTTPIGTHLFNAIAADGAKGQLKWLTVSVPTSDARKTEPTSTAAEALDRLDIPADLKQRLNDAIWIGGSLIISDADLGPETGEGTDFIVLTH